MRLCECLEYGSHTQSILSKYRVQHFVRLSGQHPGHGYLKCRRLDTAAAQT